MLNIYDRVSVVCHNTCDFDIQVTGTRLSLPTLAEFLQSAHALYSPVLISICIIDTASTGPMATDKITLCW